MGEVTSCGVCGGGKLRTLLDLGEQPLAERDSPERYPLALAECQDCTLVQLSYIVDQHEMFPLEHPYATGNTRALREHFGWLAAQLAGYCSIGDVVVDIGANDGTLLGSYSGELRRVAVEPTNQAAKCRAQGIATYQDFFSWNLARKIAREQGKAKVITATNVLAHVPGPHDFLTGVVDLLEEDGVFVTENHDVASIIDGLQVDTIYHEHLRYYSPGSLAYLLGRHGLRVDAVESIPTHGGSFRVTARKHRPGFGHRAESARLALRSLVGSVAATGAHIYGIGATTRATPIIHYAGIAGWVACVCEVAGSEKIGQRMPGTIIPIVDEALLVENQPEYALLFAWHIAGDLIPKLRFAGYKGKFIIPLPEPRILVDA